MRKWTTIVHYDATVYNCICVFDRVGFGVYSMIPNSVSIFLIVMGHPFCISLISLFAAHIHMVLI
jgi:hypothetical protein